MKLNNMNDYPNKQASSYNEDPLPDPDVGLPSSVVSSLRNMSAATLDKVLGIAQGLQERRQDTRNAVMRRILPEVFQPYELKEAEVKEEGPKTFHGEKYDRRMKFNTALERSDLKTSEDYPNWLKEAADGSFDCSGVTGRENVINVENELNRTPPLPTEEPYWYDVPNKPVMQKSAELTQIDPRVIRLIAREVAEYGAMSVGRRKSKNREPKLAATEESFTQRHPLVLPTILGVGGAALGAIPGAIYGGRSAVRSANKAYSRNVRDTLKDLNQHIKVKDQFIHPGNTRAVAKQYARERFRLDEAFRRAAEKVPKKEQELALGRFGGGVLGGLTGGSLGVIGGDALNEPYFTTEPSKQAAEESFAQRHPLVIPTATALGGAALGAIHAPMLSKRLSGLLKWIPKKPTVKVSPKSTSTPSGSGHTFFGQEVTPAPVKPPTVQPKPSVSKEDVQNMARRAAEKSKLELGKTMPDIPTPVASKAVGTEATKISPQRVRKEVSSKPKGAPYQHTTKGEVNYSDFIPMMI